MMLELGWEAWATLGIIVLMLVVLVRDLAPPDLTLLGCLGLLLVIGILPPEQAFAGLANKAVLAVGALFVIAAGIQNTGALHFVDRLLFPASKSLPMATARLMVSTASMSAFMNNTPIVAMLIPRVRDWCERMGVPASKLMIPLSFGAIVGGMTTLIGTSTNLLVVGMMEASGFEGLRMFDFAWIGVPAALAAIVYFVLIGHRLLPDRSKGNVAFEDGLRDGIFEVRVANGSPQAGLSIEEAGLRALGEAYLVHLIRSGEIIQSSPEIMLRSGDILTFAGSANVLDKLLGMPGLERVKEAPDEPGHLSLPLFEAVVAPTSMLVGKSLREVEFRERYNGVVLGIYRHEAPIEGSVSRVRIKPGDLLLVEAGTGFDTRWNQRRDEFYLVAPRRPEQTKPQVGRSPVALAILAAVVLLAATGVADIVTTAFIGALAMIATRCLSGQMARRAINFQILIIIAAALGIGKAIETTGLAAAVAHLVVEHSPAFGTIGVLTTVYIATSLMTEVITNNAAAALMVGVGLAAAQEIGAPPEAFALAVAIAASASFLTPIGYQTNLMVLAAGGYRFADFMRSGLLVTIIVAATAITMISLVWL